MVPLTDQAPAGFLAKCCWRPSTRGSRYWRKTVRKRSRNFAACLALRRVPLMGGGSSTVLVEPPQGAAPAVALPDASPAPAPAPEATAPAAASSPAIAEAPPAAAPAVPESITYKLAIKPWGTVYVDGAERGVSPPLKRLALTPGKHQIRVVNPSFPDYLTEVDQQDGKSGTIAHDFPAGNK
jgi:hypothetical protein